MIALKCLRLISPVIVPDVNGYMTCSSLWL